MQRFTISPLGDAALVISFGNRLDEAVNQKVLQLFHRVKNIPFVVDVVPAYSSLTVYYNVPLLHTAEKPAYEKAKETLLFLLNQEENQRPTGGREITIPVCYARQFALDIEELAARSGITTTEVVRLHTAKVYRVYTIGFLPGFPYMGTVDQKIATPRKSSPRTAVPAGSVGIAGEQTGIYPLASPGGWNIIGRTPLKLFDPQKAEPVLLQPGDRVRFVSISEDEFNDF